MNEFSVLLEQLRQPATYPAALATLVAVRGSSYRRVGARFLLNAQGSSFGTLSGGCLEADVAARCARVRDGGIPEFVVYDTREENDLLWGVGLGCHGVVEILIEPLRVVPDWVEAADAARRAHRPITLAVTFGPSPDAPRGTALGTMKEGGPSLPGTLVESVPPPLRLLVFGAGDDARPLVRLGSALGWEVSVFDPRPALPTAERFPEATAWHTGSISELVAAATTDAHAAVVIMTHHYVHDRPLLAALRRRSLAYLGLLGPRARAERLIAEIEVEEASLLVPMGASKPAILHAPVGLDLGGDGPAAVALAIVAEIQACLSGRDARPLRERQQPIHSR